MSENYQLKTQLSATGKKIYYKAVASHIIADPDKGDASDNWLTDKWGNFNNTLTEVIGVYDTYAGLPDTAELEIGDYALVTDGHKLYRVIADGSAKVWTPSANGEVVGSTRLFGNLGDNNKLYRWGGSSFVSAGGGSDAAGAPVIFANRIKLTNSVQDAVSGVTPGKRRIVIYQASTDDPKIVSCTYNNGTASWQWDTTGGGVSVTSIYGSAWQSALYIEIDTGRYYTINTSDNHLALANPVGHIKLVQFTKYYSGSGWQSSLTSDAANPAGAGKRALVFTPSSGVVWCDCVLSSGNYVWDTDNTTDASSDINPAYLYSTTADGKLWMYVEGTGMVLIAVTGVSGSGGSSNVTFENFGDGTTYPNPTSWTPGE